VLSANLLRSSFEICGEYAVASSPSVSLGRTLVSEAPLRTDLSVRFLSSNAVGGSVDASQNTTGRLVSPRKFCLVIRSTGPTTSYSGMRDSSASSATFASSRASGAPMQWWMPSPKPK
jgi:hypothetical protein